LEQQQQQKVSTGGGNNSPLIYLQPGDYWLVAWSIVDQSWGSTGQGYPTTMGPQSYLSNARTNPGWSSKASTLNPLNPNNPGIDPMSSKVNGGLKIDPRIVKGRQLWPSDPVLVRVSSEGTVTVISQVLQCAHWNRTTSIGNGPTPIPPSKVENNNGKNTTSTISHSDNKNNDKNNNSTSAGASAESESSEGQPIYTGGAGSGVEGTMDEQIRVVDSGKSGKKSGSKQADKDLNYATGNYKRPPRLMKYMIIMIGGVSLVYCIIAVCKRVHRERSRGIRIGQNRRGGGGR
jgi:hypothetical protein